MLIVNGKQQAIVLLIHGMIAVALVAAATFLAYEHDLDSQSLATILGAAIGLVGGSAGSFAIVGLTQNGASKQPPTPPATGGSVSPPS